MGRARKVEQKIVEAPKPKVREYKDGSKSDNPVNEDYYTWPDFKRGKNYCISVFRQMKRDAREDYDYDEVMRIELIIEQFSRKIKEYIAYERTKPQRIVVQQPVIVERPVVREHTREIVRTEIVEKKAPFARQLLYLTVMSLSFGVVKTGFEIAIATGFIASGAIAPWIVGVLGAILVTSLVSLALNMRRLATA